MLYIAHQTAQCLDDNAVYLLFVTFTITLHFFSLWKKNLFFVMPIFRVAIGMVTFKNFIFDLHNSNFLVSSSQRICDLLPLKAIL